MRAEERAEERGEYGISSLLKQKIKGKNLLRHLQRRNFFFKIFYVMKCLRSKKRLNSLLFSSVASARRSVPREILAAKTGWNWIGHSE